MIREAIASPDPVLFFEPKGRYWEKGDVVLDAGSSRPRAAPRVLRAGTDLTLVAYGPTVATALAAAEAAAAEGRARGRRPAHAVPAGPRHRGGVGAPDRPLRRRARGAAGFFGAGAELAARVTEECFYSLEAPVLRVGGFHTPVPGVASSRTSTCRASTGCSTPSTARCAY